MKYDPVKLEIYKGLFSSVCEEMGEVLRLSSFSPNIRERKDFSCALFNAEFEMIAQAAHIPVHLGSMGLAVSEMVRFLEKEKNNWRPQRGDVWITNDPFRGGTHLPDITLVSPVFVGTDKKLWGDPIRQTRAAAKLIKIYRKLLPDWGSTVTSYNSGVGRMQRLLRKHKVVNLEGLLAIREKNGLGFAGRNFYAEVVAAYYVEKYKDVVFEPWAISLEKPTQLKHLPSEAKKFQCMIPKKKKKKKKKRRKS